jgi:hypothetical protein
MEQHYFGNLMTIEEQLQAFEVEHRILNGLIEQEVDDIIHAATVREMIDGSAVGYHTRLTHLCKVRCSLAQASRAIPDRRGMPFEREWLSTTDPRNLAATSLYGGYLFHVRGDYVTSYLGFSCAIVAGVQAATEWSGFRKSLDDAEEFGLVHVPAFDDVPERYGGPALNPVTDPDFDWPADMKPTSIFDANGNLLPIEDLRHRIKCDYGL